MYRAEALIQPRAAQEGCGRGTVGMYIGHFHSERVGKPRGVCHIRTDGSWTFHQRAWTDWQTERCLPCLTACRVTTATPIRVPYRERLRARLCALYRIIHMRKCCDSMRLPEGQSRHILSAVHRRHKQTRCSVAAVSDSRARESLQHTGNCKQRQAYPGLLTAPMHGAAFARKQPDAALSDG